MQWFPVFVEWVCSDRDEVACGVELRFYGLSGLYPAICCLDRLPKWNTEMEIVRGRSGDCPEFKLQLVFSKSTLKRELRTVT
jgi:hypothetical protein